MALNAERDEEDAASRLKVQQLALHDAETRKAAAVRVLLRAVSDLSNVRCEAMAATAAADEDEAVTEAILARTIPIEAATEKQRSRIAAALRCIDKLRQQTQEVCTQRNSRLPQAKPEWEAERASLAAHNRELRRQCDEARAALQAAERTAQAHEHDLLRVDTEAQALQASLAMSTSKRTEVLAELQAAKADGAALAKQLRDQKRRR